MKTILVSGLLLLAAPVYADDCRIVEFPDHFEAICTGTAKPLPTAPDNSAAEKWVNTPAGNQTSEQHSGQNTDTAASSQPASAAGRSASSGGAGSRYVKMKGRQGRPDSDVMNAAIEARRKLIDEHRQ